MSHDLNEAETQAELIDPVIAAVGWGKVDSSRPGGVYAWIVQMSCYIKAY